MWFFSFFSCFSFAFNWSDCDDHQDRDDNNGCHKSKPATAPPPQAAA